MILQGQERLLQVSSVCVFYAIAPFAPAALAQDSVVDPEQLIEEQDGPAAPGRLLDTVFETLPAARDRLRQDYGISYAGNHFAGIYTDVDEGEVSSAGLAGLAVRWDIFNRAAPNQGSVIAYVENRHEIGGTASTAFNAAFGPAFSPNALNSAGEFTRLRQLYYRQALFDDALITAFGKFALRANFSFSPLTTNRFRNFQSSAMSLAPTAPWPGDSVGLYARWQPADRHWGVTAAVVDAAPEVNGFDFDIDGPYVLGSIYLMSEPWRPDSGTPPPPHYVQATVYRQPDAAGRPEGWGMIATYDLRLRPEWSVGLRYGYAEEDLSPVEQNAAAVLVFNNPFLRASDGVGIGVAWSREAASAEDVLTAEAFYRWNVIPGFELTPTVQMAMSDDRGDELIFGLRTGLSF
ncbi:carbohydrate porin [Eilatimonas milleporae]|uniref:Carbohydrate-selective porin OprB n=1 Tax=Eilatimonas milleporae TaxID=911205 RepID=A0A3M0BWN6_9PROT|nr:carbohydrate porin [Eilatimonas milleporae]RMB02004.1 carbohydrate-selective porin OprB [Eilatimonas milleporae]